MDAFSKYESKTSTSFSKGCTHCRTSSVKHLLQDHICPQHSLERNSKNQSQLKETKITQELQSQKQDTSQQKLYQPEVSCKALVKDICGVKSKAQKEVPAQTSVKSHALLKNIDQPQVEVNDRIKPLSRQLDVEPLDHTKCSCSRVPTDPHHTKRISKTRYGDHECTEKLPKNLELKPDILDSPDDGVLYRNENFGKSSCAEHSSKTTRTYKFEEPSDLLTNAREYCKKMNKHFLSKFEEIDNDNLVSDFEDLSTQSSSDSDLHKPTKIKLDKLANTSSSSVSTVKTNRLNISPKTVLSAMSGADLRKIVISQIKTQEYIRKCKIKNRNKELETNKATVSELPLSNPLGDKQLKDEATTENGNKVIPVSEQHINDPHKGLKDINYIKEKINSRIITPMIGKVKRLYLNHLNEEMTIVEELERVPDQVGDLYEVFYGKQ